MDITLLMNVTAAIFHPVTILLILLGVAIGIFMGAMPGLNGPIGVALLLPVTYGLSPANGLLMLGGIYMGATYGGSISAILLNVPGTGESACTAIEGNPLARQGRAKEALYYSIISSSFGGIIGLLAMIFFTPPLVEMALKFGPAEMFLVAVAGLAVVGSILGKSPAKGFIATGIGLLISMVGIDHMSVGGQRLTFGLQYLVMGVPLIPVSVGLFAMTEMINLSMSARTRITAEVVQDFSLFQGLKENFKYFKTLFKSAIIGTIIGILPGTGAAISSFVAYGEAKRSSKKDKTPFSEGNVEGIIAPESANNASVGGSFVPLLALGIPGSATSAIIFGALMIHGLQPGPKLFIEHAEITYTFMLGMPVSVVFMFLIGTFGIKYFSKIITIPVTFIIPTVLVFAVVGTYSTRNSVSDVLVSIAFAFFGVFFKKAKIPIPPIILGIILGAIVEDNFRRCIVGATAAQENIISYIFFRPISLILIVFVGLIIYGNIKAVLFASKSADYKAPDTQSE
jgi:putative tricarboxylic transport membrane protein